MAKCGICRTPLPKRQPEKIFRLLHRQRKGLSEEAQAIRRWLGRSPLCEACAAACRATGLRLETQAEVVRRAQRQAAVTLIERLRPEDVEKLKKLQASLGRVG